VCRTQGDPVRALLVEDDEMIGRSLMHALDNAGWSVDWVRDGALAHSAMADGGYTCVLLDLGLPKEDGTEVLRRARKRGDATPVLVLTARDGLDDRIQTLDLGADDYLLKPFEPAELEARVRALVRRGLGERNPLLACGALTLDRSTGTVAVAGRPVALRRRELAVLEGLMTRAGKVVPKEKIAGEVFGFDEPVAPNAVELYVARLRKKLEPDGPQIRTIRGLGYMIDRS